MKRFLREQDAVGQCQQYFAIPELNQPDPLKYFNGPFGCDPSPDYKQVPSAISSCVQKTTTNLATANKCQQCLDTLITYKVQQYTTMLWNLIQNHTPITLTVQKTDSNGKPVTNDSGPVMTQEQIQIKNKLGGQIQAIALEIANAGIGAKGNASNDPAAIAWQTVCHWMFESFKSQVLKLQKTDTMLEFLPESEKPIDLDLGTLKFYWGQWIKARFEGWFISALPNTKDNDGHPLSWKGIDYLSIINLGEQNLWLKVYQYTNTSFHNYAQFETVMKSEVEKQEKIVLDQIIKAAQQTGDNQILDNFLTVIENMVKQSNVAQLPLCSDVAVKYNLLVGSQSSVPYSLRARYEKDLKDFTTRFLSICEDIRVSAQRTTTTPTLDICLGDSKSSMPDSTLFLFDGDMAIKLIELIDQKISEVSNPAVAFPFHNLVLLYKNQLTSKIISYTGTVQNCGFWRNLRDTDLTPFISKLNGLIQEYVSLDSDLQAFLLAMGTPPVDCANAGNAFNLLKTKVVQASPDLMANPELNKKVNDAEKAKNNACYGNTVRLSCTELTTKATQLLTELNLDTVYCSAAKQALDDLTKQVASQVPFVAMGVASDYCPQVIDTLAQVQTMIGIRCDGKTVPGAGDIAKSVRTREQDDSPPPPPAEPTTPSCSSNVNICWQNATKVISAPAKCTAKNDCGCCMTTLATREIYRDFARQLYDYVISSALSVHPVDKIAPLLKDTMSKAAAYISIPENYNSGKDQPEVWAHLAGQLNTWFNEAKIAIKKIDDDLSVLPPEKRTFYLGYNSWGYAWGEIEKEFQARAMAPEQGSSNQDSRDSDFFRSLYNERLDQCRAEIVQYIGKEFENYNAFYSIAVEIVKFFVGQLRIDIDNAAQQETDPETTKKMNDLSAAFLADTDQTRLSCPDKVIVYNKFLDLSPKIGIQLRATYEKTLMGMQDTLKSKCENNNIDKQPSFDPTTSCTGPDKVAQDAKDTAKTAAGQPVLPPSPIGTDMFLVEGTRMTKLIDYYNGLIDGYRVEIITYLERFPYLQQRIDDTRTFVNSIVGTWGYQMVTCDQIQLLATNIINNLDKDLNGQFKTLIAQIENFDIAVSEIQRMWKRLPSSPTNVDCAFLGVTRDSLNSAFNGLDSHLKDGTIREQQIQPLGAAGGVMSAQAFVNQTNLQVDNYISMNCNKADPHCDWMFVNMQKIVDNVLSKQIDCNAGYLKFQAYLDDLKTSTCLAKDNESKTWMAQLNSFCIGGGESGPIRTLEQAPIDRPGPGEYEIPTDSGCGKLQNVAGRIAQNIKCSLTPSVPGCKNNSGQPLYVQVINCKEMIKARQSLVSEKDRLGSLIADGTCSQTLLDINEASMAYVSNVEGLIHYYLGSLNC